jgi:hypothetical protein
MRVLAKKPRQAIELELELELELIQTRVIQHSIAVGGSGQKCLCACGSPVPDFTMPLFIPTYSAGTLRLALWLGHWPLVARLPETMPACGIGFAALTLPALARCLPRCLHADNACHVDCPGTFQ